MFKNKRYEEGSDCSSSCCHLTNFFYHWASSLWPWLSSAHFSVLLLPLISDIAMDCSVHLLREKNSHFMLFGHWEQQLLKYGETVHFKCGVQISDPERFPDLCEKLGNFTLWWKPCWRWGEVSWGGSWLGGTALKTGRRWQSSLLGRQQETQIYCKKSSS